MKLTGEMNNIYSYTSCMTRLRVSVKNLEKVDLKGLKAIEGVLGLNENGEELQLIFGPGKVKKAYIALDELYKLTAKNQMGREENFEETVKNQKNTVKTKRTSKFQGFMANFSNILVPLIPGFIAAGMLAGLAGVCKELNITGDWVDYINVFNKSLTKFMYIMIGFNATKSFGGNSGMIGILFTTIIAAKFEIFIREKFSWESTDIITTPIITLLGMGTLTYILIMPLSFKLFGLMNYAFVNLNGNPIGGGILAGLFLPSVMMGIHQGFVPVYQGLVETTGMNSLFPILAMAGAGQVGFTFGLNTVFGSSGILGSFAMTSNKGVLIAIVLYVSALVIAYISGFFLTYLFGCKNVDLS